MHADGAGGGAPPDIYTCATDGLVSLLGRSKEQCIVDTLLAPRSMGATDVRRSWGNDPCTAADDGGGDNPDDPTDHSTPPIDRPSDPPDDPGPFGEMKREAVRGAQAVMADPKYRADHIAAGPKGGYNTTATAYREAVWDVGHNLSFVPADDPDMVANGHPAGLTKWDTNDNTVQIKISDTLPPETMKATILAEFNHALLDHAQIDHPNPNINDTEKYQHEVLCKYFNDCHGVENGGKKYCPDGSSCTACSAAGGLISDILSCGYSLGLPPALPRGGGVIDPSPESDSSAPSWGSCFGPGMFPIVPTSCLALDCADGSAPVLNDSQRCVCSSGGSVFMPPIINCGAVHCSDGGIAAPSGAGCVCQPFGQDPLFPPGLPPASCPLCTRIPDPTLSRCISRPQMCFFESGPAL